MSRLKIAPILACTAMALCGGALAPGRALAAARSDDQAGSDVQGPMPAPGDAGVAPAAGPWTFEALVHAIVKTNPRIRAQVAAAGAARFDVSAAKWQYFPSPAVQAEAAGNDRQIIASVTQPLVTFGRLGADLRAAKSRASLADTRIDEARYQLAFRALELYGQLASAQRAEQVLRGDVARLSALGELISRRVTAGASAPVDLNLVLTRIRQSENAMISLRTRQQTARDALGELLGASVQGAEIIVPDGAALSPLMAETPQPDMVPQALSHSPVLRRAAGEIDVALTDKQRALGAVKPTIFGRLEKRFDYGSYDYSAFPQFRALIGVQYSMGSGLSAFDRVRAAAAQADVARLNRDAAVADVRSAILTDMDTLEASRRLVASLRANVEAQQEAVESFNRLFLAGKRNWLDVLNMARELTSSQRDLGDAEVQLLVTNYRIQLQTGQIAW